MDKYIPLIPVFPLIAFIINIFFGKLVKEKASWISLAMSFVSLAFALPVMMMVAKGQILSAQTTWLTLGSYELSMGYLLDPLSATLLFVVTVIGPMIVLYASGYMHEDPRYSRFFAYVSLFLSAMLTLVISNNYILFFMAWEVMGLCSYLLIGFWFEKNSAADAGRKAFLTTRVGDVGFFIGIMTLFVAAGTLNFADLHHVAESKNPMLAIAALFIFCGTIGKSAQFPLHVWLPDAMEGPTPVSALIHAATMVAAGVFLVARSFVLFAAFPNVMQVVTTIGAITALMAAFIGLTSNDIKKILAYSTISQLGFMVTALGLGGLAAGTFHLVTHAFFKALLFLGAGSVIHGTHTQDIRQMGGLFGKMKHTAATFLIGSLAIAGVPPLSGFWSKDEILVAAWDAHNYFVFTLLVIAAFMTAFYMFRLIFLVFFGEQRDHHMHPHESPAVMTTPLWVLAIGAILVGIPGSPFMGHWFQNFLAGPHHGEHHAHVLNWFVIGCSVAAGLGGIALAALFYLKPSKWPERIASTFKPLYQLSTNKFWFDEIYTVIFIRPFQAVGRLLFSFDQKVVDGAVNGAGDFAVATAAFKQWIDKYIVDGLVNFAGFFTQFASAMIRMMQTGFVQHYLLIVMISVIGLIFFQFRP